MPALIVSGGNRKEDNESVIWIDSTVNFKPIFSARVTEHPLSDSSTSSDNIVIRNATFSISGVIGGNPIYEFPDNEVDNNTSPQEQPTGSVINRPSNSRVQSAYDTLMKLFRSKESFDVVAELERYESCYITSLSFPQDVNSNEVLNVEMECVQVRVVVSEDIALFIAEPKKDDATGVTNKGGNTKTDATNDPWYVEAYDAFILGEGRTAAGVEEFSDSFFSGET